VIKYGALIGESTTDIARGEHVHVHNVASPQRATVPLVVDRTSARLVRPDRAGSAAEFMGYRRADGGAGTRNLVLVLPSVGCSQGCARQIVQGLRGAVHLPNTAGCGQMGEDRVLVKRTLVGFGVHPDVAAVLVVGNGCEQLPPAELAAEIASTGKRVEAISVQEVGGTRKTVALGRKIVRDMIREAARLDREPIPLDALILGTECGGSDYTSGLSANPAVGVASDRLVAAGGTVLLSETPEILGAEHLLVRRVKTREGRERLLCAASWWEERAIASGQDIREGNPSPGNIAGGLTTLEEKSLGCIHKAGTAPIEEVVYYACPPTRRGLIYMDTPAHDVEQLTGMVAGGAQVVVFTTGLGTPCGSPLAPVIKITGNAATYRTMRDNTDLDVSRILLGKETIEQGGMRIFDEIVAIASGRATKAEKLDQRDFGIFKMNPNI
jgi:altronate dehydratase large subunit